MDMKFKSKNKFKVLVLTLYAGENEFEECLNSLKTQTYKNWDHIIIKNLPNKEAHDKLYKTIMENKNSYDIFIKLDADMLFINENKLEEMINFYKVQKNTDQIIFSIKDWYSELDILGINMFSSRVKWEINSDNLFVDHNPIIPGKKMILWYKPAPVAFHSPNPSYEEAFLFGYHRGLKIKQRHRNIKNSKTAKYHLNLLENTFSSLKKNYDKRKALALLGANYAFDNNNLYLFSKEEFMSSNKVLDELIRLSDDKIITIVIEKWNKFRVLNYKLKLIFIPYIKYIIKIGK